MWFYYLPETERKAGTSVATELIYLLSVLQHVNWTDCDSDEGGKDQLDFPARN